MGTKLPRKLEQKMSVVGEQIKLARLRRNLSVAQVAERATCSPLTVSRIEKGAPTVAIGIYLRVLYALQLDDDITQALLKYEQMNEIAERLPGLDCGACGAPNCEALAEDIVHGEATEDACIVLLKERLAQEKLIHGEKGTDHAEKSDG